jgi:16S rRNA (cytidine1402-2'-O)-methyltransferase
MDKKGVLYVVATPLGNLEDITRRAVRIIGEVDLIAAEDTRRSMKLLSHLGISKPHISHYKHNQKKSAGAVLSKLRQGMDVALLTDAGTPGLSDPGAFLVSMAREAGFLAVPVPGPSALAAAVSVSEISCDTFTFAGFLPARKGARREKILKLRDREEPLIFYEAPHRLLPALEDMREILGDRMSVLARELTKIHEEVMSAPLSELIKIYRRREPRGEITLIVSGKQEAEPSYDQAELERELKKRLLRDGSSLKEAVDELRLLYPLSRRELYRVALAVKQGRDPGED